MHVTVKALNSYSLIYFAESLYFVRSSIQLPTVKETDAPAEKAVTCGPSADVTVPVSFEIQVIAA